MITRLSCGIVVYDEVSDIKRLISNLQNELADYKTQWIFVLNHEQADIRHWIKAWISENIKNSICLENPSNNLGYARQLLLETATENYIYMTDPDVEIKPGSLKKLIELAEASELVETSSKTIGFGGLLIYRSNNLFLQKTFDFIFAVAQQIPFSFQIQHHSHLSVVDHIPSCHLLLKRTPALEVGGFSVAFSSVGEDLDFSHRAFNLNYRFIFSPEASAFHFQNLTFSQWIRRVFSYGQVQVTVQKLHFKSGLRFYRLIPMALLISFLVLTYLFTSFAFISMIFAILVGIIRPGFCGFLITVLVYSVGEFFELIFPVLEIKSAEELQAEKLILQSSVLLSKYES